MAVGQLQLLGTGTCQLLPNQAASSVLIEIDDLRVVYDFGRGISTRLSEIELKQDDVQHVIISHFHPDHWSDLIPYLHGAAWSQIDQRKTDLHIYAPAGMKKFFGKMFDLFGGGEIVRKEFYEVMLHEIPSDSLEIENVRFDYIDLSPAGNRGLKFAVNGKKYALTGDSNFHEKEIGFLKDVDFAVVDSGHITDEEIVELAVSSKAKKIVCSHQYRKLNQKKLNGEAASKGYKGTISVGKDLEEFPF